MNKIDPETFSKIKERMNSKFPILLEGYLRDAKAYLVTIETNMPDGSLADLVEAAHSLKSASGLLGVLHVHKLAETLEYEGKDLQKENATHFGNLESVFKNLQNAFSEVESDLKVELNKNKY